MPIRLQEAASMRQILMRRIGIWRHTRARSGEAQAEGYINNGRFCRLRPV